MSLLNILCHLMYTYAQSCPTLCDHLDCSLTGSSVHAIFQAIILEWVVVSSSRRSSPSRNRTHIPCISCITGRFFTTEPSQKSHKSPYLREWYFWLFSVFCIHFLTSHISYDLLSTYNFSSKSYFSIKQMLIAKNIFIMPSIMHMLNYVLLCSPMDCCWPGSSVHEIFQVGILEWLSSFRGSLTKGSNPHLLSLLKWQAGYLPVLHLESPIFKFTH